MCKISIKLRGFQTLDNLYDKMSKISGRINWQEHFNEEERETYFKTIRLLFDRFINSNTSY